ncbi:MAG: tRNA 5'-guanylyltransferase [Methanotrichaceae archaeon]|nr:tRNA 5'-guanylyltransferase [Methanotrichaceae archaeon]
MQNLSEKTAKLEIFSGIKTRSPIIVRADGRGFKKILENSRKPYDLDFAEKIVKATDKLFKESGFSPTLAFVFSDEINLLFMEAPFSGRVEKIDSVVASFISAALALEIGRIVSMDCRIITIYTDEVARYLSERQDEVWRNHVFSYGFYMLVDGGESRYQAMELLRGMKEDEIHEFVFQRGVNLAKTAAWERRGVLIYRDDGKVIHNWDLPLFRSGQGQKLLNDIIETCKTV